MDHTPHVSWAAGAGAGPGAPPPQFNNNNNNNHNHEEVEAVAHPATTATVMESIFNVGPRFSNFKVVGKGSFGEVCSALDSHQVRT